jgi:hypothetical protein
MPFQVTGLNVLGKSCAILGAKNLHHGSHKSREISKALCPLLLQLSFSAPAI